MTRDQTIAVRTLASNWGSASEAMLSLEGIVSTPHTMRSLVRRGMVRRDEWLGESDGYSYSLTDAGRWAAACSSDPKAIGWKP